MSVIVKLSDGSKIRVKGVNSREELMERCEALVEEKRIASVEKEFSSGFSDSPRSSAHTYGVCSTGDFRDWREVYNEETRRGLYGGKGRKNEPTGKAKPRRFANSRKWRGFGVSPWGKE